MVLEPVLCPECGNEDVVKNGTRMVSPMKASSGTYADILIAVGVASSETTLIRAIYLPSNNRLQTWQLTAVEFVTRQGY